MQSSKPLTISGKNALYATTNRQYGTAWAQDGKRAQKFDLKKQIVPTYGEIVDSMNDFKKTQRLIKNKVIQEKLEAEGVTINQKFKKTTQFPIKQNTSYNYPSHGLNVGPSIYRTNNMNYGSQLPTEHELPNKYYPCNSSFTKGFSGNFKFNGLNTVKTVSGVHNNLNDI